MQNRYDGCLTPLRLVLNSTLPHPFNLQEKIDVVIESFQLWEKDLRNALPFWDYFVCVCNSLFGKKNQGFCNLYLLNWAVCPYQYCPHQRQAFSFKIFFIPPIYCFSACTECLLSLNKSVWELSRIHPCVDWLVLLFLSGCTSDHSCRCLVQACTGPSMAPVNKEVHRML